MRWTKKLLGGAMAAVMLLNITACSGEPSSGGEESGVSGNMSDEERIIAAAEAGKVGNWGLGNEYEIQALLTKYGQSTDYVSMDFTMDQFDQDAITLASAMTFNELGLVVNNYEGAYGYVPVPEEISA